jgi:UDP-N-acetylmuramate dehydrogenase
MVVPSFIKNNVLLKNHCTLRIGGFTDYFVAPENEQQLIKAVNFAKKNSIPYFVIGHGSNLLFDDKGYQGLIIKLAEKFAKIDISDNRIKVQSGAWMPYVARKSQSAGLTGLEHTVGIPGNIGGIIAMNAGSQRKSVATNLIQINVVTENGEKLELTPEQCGFGYRQSIFQNNKWIILEAEFELEKGDRHLVRHTMRSILKERRLKFPRKQPNVGSVFKSNPTAYQKYGPPGKIIEDLGLKGYCNGGICISKKHANFFVNNGDGNAYGFKKLVDMVNAKANYILVPEVIYV